MAGTWTAPRCTTEVSRPVFSVHTTLFQWTYRAAKKYSRRGIINAHELLQKEMAVDCITFSWFPDPDTGVLGVVWSVILFAVGTYGMGSD